MHTSTLQTDDIMSAYTYRYLVRYSTYCLVYTSCYNIEQSTGTINLYGVVGFICCKEII